MNSTESTTCGYRTNRAAQVRMEEIRRKLSEQPKQSTAKPKHSHVQHSSEPLNRYLHMKKPTREKKLEETSVPSKENSKTTKSSLKQKLRANTLAYIKNRRNNASTRDHEIRKKTA
ncbi:uncharacterized protein LOC106666259 isoform X2 [Cimex lectularius]|uniref:Uncharacterized protein n=1 Tax=Cimex lectularius TaxID=79782 RepID=A0A8I6RP09_CIMLE|nr:uncharacterized protein LOC106666259 isoform X2 [Cimex lectularius]XP_014248817.1 uncharacterized protein LOC106666259 isoform X2 [Cimex lectularius]